MIPASVRIVVDWMHIREAERVATGGGGRAKSPFALALGEQTRFISGRISAHSVFLRDHEGQEIRYGACEPLQAYLKKWKKGEAVEPTIFHLEIAQ